jgi:hypothetical protein
MGVFEIFTKGNAIGQETRFGPNWPGTRCEARTRRGTLCQRPAKLPVGRCRLHGGASTGPRTEEGRARLAALHTTHGRLTKEKRAEAKRRAEVGRQINAEVRAIEAWALYLGHLSTDWRKDWDTL